MKNFILTILVWAITMSAHAATWYVNTNATGANDGTSWSDAFTNLQDGIAASVFGDQIWVAAGTYKPTTTSSRTINFKIKNGTKIYGGFNATETALNQRDFTNNITILSGEIGTGAANDNTYNVVYFINVGNQTELDGVTIMGGYNSTSLGIGGSDGRGGGIHSNNSSPLIKNCKIIGNFASEAGGGISHGGSGNVTIENCVFDGNISGSQGGAINLFTGTNNSIVNCYIKSNNASGSGGAICVAAGPSNINLTISNTVVAGNTGNSSIIYFNAGSLVNIYNCLIVGNYVNTSGVIRTETSSSSKNNKIVNTTIAHNGQGETGSSSRAILLNSNSSIVNSIVYGNTGASQILAVLPVNNSIVQAGSQTLTGSNIIASNPEFILPGSASNAPFDTTGLNYRVTNLSPAIDFGLNANVVGTTDLDGNARIQNTTVDLGPYEKAFCNATLSLSPAGPYAICGGTPITLSVDDAVDILWSTSEVTNSISVSSAGNYAVAFEDINGCRGTAQAVVSASALPDPSIAFTNGNLQTGTFASYQWSFNGMPIAGATSNTHVPLEGYGVYEVFVVNNAGCSASKSHCFSPATISTSGPLSFCEGGNVTLTVNDGTSQVWSTGSLNPTITVSSSGTYFANVSSAAAGCTVKLEEVVTVHANPTPTISTSGTNLSTQTFSSYQWFYNGTPISGGTTKTIEPINGNGQYTVVVTNSNDCEGTSAIFNLTNVGVEAISKSAFTVYPNPVKANEILQLVWENQLSGNVTLKICDLTGSVVYTRHSETLPSSIELTGLNSGLYFVIAETNYVQVMSNRFVVE